MTGILKRVRRLFTIAYAHIARVLASVSVDEKNLTDAPAAGYGCAVGTAIRYRTPKSDTLLAMGGIELLQSRFPGTKFFFRQFVKWRGQRIEIDVQVIGLRIYMQHTGHNFAGSL